MTQAVRPGALEFEVALPMLASAYQRGQLVPFLGSGMSYPACASWPQFVAGLEARVVREDAAPREAPDETAAGLVRRANAAVRALKLLGRSAFEEAVLAALAGEPQEVPEATKQVARLYWPLILTTNYDDLFSSEWSARNGESLAVLGRRPRDCQRILEALRAPMPPCLWALQGFLGGQFERTKGSKRSFWRLVPRPHVVRERLEAMSEVERRRLPDDRSLVLRLLASKGASFSDDLKAMAREAGRLLQERESELRAQLVVGHEEYRRVTFLEPTFRRAFAEVYRSRSLLFLGSGLAEQYLLNLFGEVLETFGPNPFPHYALMKRGEIGDLEFMRSRLNTFVIEFDDFGELPGLLGRVVDECQAPKARSVGWRFDLTARVGESPVVEVALKEPEGLAAGECVLRPTEAEQPKEDSERLTPEGHTLARDRDEPFYSLRGENGSAELVARATQELLDAANRGGSTHVRILLSAFVDAGIDKYFALKETIRATGRWLRTHPTGERVRRVTIHVTDAGLAFDLRAGRIDVPELLTHDALLYWVNVELEDGQIVREPIHTSSSTSVLDLAQRRQIPFTLDGAWCVGVEPPPVGRVYVRSLATLQQDGAKQSTLAALGVAPGSTLRFYRGRELVSWSSPEAPSALATDWLDHFAAKRFDEPDGEGGA